MKLLVFAEWLRWLAARNVDINGLFLNPMESSRCLGEGGEGILKGYAEAAAV